MMKYVDVKEVFAEIPDEITLAISISGCPIHCPGCHSQYLWADVGEPLTAEALDEMLKSHIGITCGEAELQGPHRMVQRSKRIAARDKLEQLRLPQDRPLRCRQRTAERQDHQPTPLPRRARKAHGHHIPLLEVRLHSTNNGFHRLNGLASCKYAAPETVRLLWNPLLLFPTKQVISRLPLRFRP